MARKPKAITEPTNGGEGAIQLSLPYSVTVTIEGAADFLFHRWNCEAVIEKANAAKGSAAKKTDDVESYVYRNEAEELCIPGEYLRMAIVGAAKYRQDPRSPRKSAQDLFKAAVISLTNLAPITASRRGKTGGAATEWDYLDQRRAVVQRNGINRVRPAMHAGWRATFDLQISLPEYIDRNSLRETIEQAGRLIGVGDFRPTFGRFGVISFV